MTGQCEALRAVEEEQAPQFRVLPPWIEQPYQLISWLDMNKFSAQLFVNIGSSLRWMGDQWLEQPDNKNLANNAEDFLQRISADMLKIGCPISSKAASRLESDLKLKLHPEALRSRFQELKDTIFDEMAAHLFLWVPFERAQYYEFSEDKNKWSEAEKTLDGIISQRFGTAAVEIKQARVCYAVGQWTASVFHMMRACEVGIKAIYKTLGLPSPKLADSWGKLLEPMDEQLNPRSTKPKVPLWQSEHDFFSDVTNDIKGVKRAWRDSTMHVETNYDEKGALKVLNAATSLIESLCIKLDQDGKFYP